jgi:hypothetical protein
MEEYLCLTVESRPGEERDVFARRLSECWSAMLRERPDDFEMVFAESTSFGRTDERWTRQYLLEAEVADLVLERLAAADLISAPLDRDDLYTKYEAAPPDWMQIEH